MNRIKHERISIGPVWKKSFKKIDEFREKIKKLKNSAEVMSKEYMIYMEDAQKKDR